MNGGLAGFGGFSGIPGADSGEALVSQLEISLMQDQVTAEALLGAANKETHMQDPETDR